MNLRAHMKPHSAGDRVSSSLLWFRRDLRTLDNRAWSEACRHSRNLVPFYCFDPRELLSREDENGRPYGLPKMGPHRSRFTLQAVASLRGSLQQGGSGLLVYVDTPEAVVSTLLRQMCVGTERAPDHVDLHFQMDVAPESADIEERVADAFGAAGQSLGVSTAVHRHWGLTLHHPDDLSFGSGEHGRFCAVPPTMTKFRKAVAALGASVRPRVDPPVHVPPLPERFRNMAKDLSPVVPPPASAARPVAPHPVAPAPTSAPHHVAPHPDAPAPAPHPVAPAEAPAPHPVAPHPVDPLPADPAPAPALTPVAPASALHAASFCPESVPQLYSLAGAQELWTGLAQAVGVPLSQGGQDPRSVFRLDGGEAEGLERLRWFVHGEESSSGMQSATLSANLPSTITGDESTTIRANQSSPSPPNRDSRQDASPNPTVRRGHSPPLSQYAHRRALATGQDTTSLLSPFLSAGCLSVREVYRVVTAARETASTNVKAARSSLEASEMAGTETEKREELDHWLLFHESCNLLLMHLEIRDFYIFSLLREGPSKVLRWDSVPDLAQNLLQTPSSESTAPISAPKLSTSASTDPSTDSSAGPQPTNAASNAPQPARDVDSDMESFTCWLQGRTGFPYVDASMRELAATGWISNRGRQNVCSFLVHTLGVDWRRGAAAFESLLLDHDFGVNAMNWKLISSSKGKQFKTVSQGIMYDEEAELAGKWIQELSGLPPHLRHMPFYMTEEETEMYVGSLERGYPSPMVFPENQIGVVEAGRSKKSMVKKQ